MLLFSSKTMFFLPSLPILIICIVAPGNTLDPQISTSGCINAFLQRMLSHSDSSIMYVIVNERLHALGIRTGDVIIIIQ